jgi:hypothetical protein
VTAKSGTSFERDTRRSRKITLVTVRVMVIHTGKRVPYPTKLFSNHTNPRVHPIVLSPRMLCQLKIKSIENFLPATRVVKRMRTVAQT